jgi:hypothetical protein
LGRISANDKRKDKPMDKFLCHPVRTFTLDDLEKPSECAGESPTRRQTEALFVSDINLNPVTDPQELEFLAGLVPFHRIPSKMLFKVVRVATGLEVHDRWIAVRAIIARRIPIPVPKPLPEVRREGQGSNT